MAHRIDDRWLWLGLGAFTILAIKGVSYGLRRIVVLTSVHNPQLTQPAAIPASGSGLDLHAGKEDAIKTESLEVLATCTNIEIRKAATKILCDRFWAHAPSRKALYKDLRSHDEDVRHRARLAYRMLAQNGLCKHEFSTLSAHLPFGRLREREIPGSRVSRHAELEWDLRRRRREAVVVHEGDQPVSQEDVYMRDWAGRMSTESERFLEDEELQVYVDREGRLRPMETAPDAWANAVVSMDVDMRQAAERAAEEAAAT